MKLSMEWLSEFVELDNINIKDYCDRMTDTGSKVEGWEELGIDIVNVKVGRVLEITQHPDADKLVVCQIDVGEESPRQIVTGATNVTVGVLVPVACAPAKLPDNVTIKKGKLRGVESAGMLCSIDELGLTLHDMPDAPKDGILLLDEICSPGDDIKDVLKLADTVVEFEITPNRPDCLSVIGLARETAASFDISASYHTPSVKGGFGNTSDYLAVEIVAPKLCPRYSARVVKNVKIAPSPLWLRARLRASGVRPINNIVDITNYVMLEYGQPMHAFDYSCLDGKRIIVREALDGEEYVSLDDISHTLSGGMLVIADEKKAVALAGVMGGANSEIKDSTETVVFESANFLGSGVRVTSRKLGMRTESSGRFEKGLDPEITLSALERACELVELLGAGEVTDGTIDVYPGKRELRKLSLDAEQINKFLGVNLTADYMKSVLRLLDFEINGDIVTIPSFRNDIECMNDLAEEILRIYGYNTFDATLFRAEVKTGKYTPRQEYRHRLASLLCSLGLSEIYTFSFISPRYYDKIALAKDDILRESVVISNPLGEDTSVMRTTLLPSMLECLAHNANHHSQAASLYEIAAVYRPTTDKSALPDEYLGVSLGFYGDGDFYRLKGIAEEIFKDAGISGLRYAAVSDDPTYHPGRCAIIISRDGVILGRFGEIHPNVADNYGFDQPIYTATFEFERILERANFKRSYKPLPKYPSSGRDFAFVCRDDIEAATIEDIMTRAGGKLVESVKLFDVYRGKQIPEGTKSVAFSVTLRSPDHTLTDEETDRIADKIIIALESELGVTLRV